VNLVEPTAAAAGVAHAVPAVEVLSAEKTYPDGTHALQKAWAALDVPQCGYCQSGMLMAAAALLEAKPVPNDADIDQAINNICRCGTYNRVRAAIKLATTGA